MGLFSVFVDLSLAQSPCSAPHVKDFPLADKSSLACTAAKTCPVSLEIYNLAKTGFNESCTISEDAAFSSEYAQTIALTA